MISVVIVTYNEAEKLRVCLQNIHTLADEIVVVDLGSTDHVQEVVTRFKARYIQHPFVPYVELVRNFAISQCTGDWILVLDPDETLPQYLQNFLRNHAQNHCHGVLNIPRKNIFFGKWIRHTNFWPDYQIRFFSKGSTHWQNLIHSYPKIKYADVKLPQIPKYAIQHITYPTYKSFLTKQKKYAKIRASEHAEDGDSVSLERLFKNIFKEFLARYIKHGGFLDNINGIFLVLGMMYYHCSVEWELYKKRIHGKDN